MLISHIARSMILGPLAGIGAILLGGVPGFAVEGPSFDCTRGVNSALAIILCASPEAAEADWDLVSAYWAFSTDDRDQRAFSQSMNQRCALPVSPQPITRNHVRCVISAFRNRAATVRSKLKGDALAESRLSPERHMEIQNALIERGLLRNRLQNYGANPDGHFGPNTRLAIKEYQRSIEALETGYLLEKQQIALLESPQEREAREAREKARRAAREDQKRAEEQARRVEEKRREQEAEKAARWGEKIEEAKEQGPEYAARIGDLKWSLTERMNPMTEEIEYTASSTQPNGTGAVASIDGVCLKDRVVFQATLLDANDLKQPLGFPTSAGGVVGNKRINDGAVFATTFPTGGWRNRIVVSTLSFSYDEAESADTTWRTLAEVETSQGTLYIKMAMFNAKIRTLITNCQRRYELEKRQNVRQDASPTATAHQVE
jgi:peptidoglycan hydrolase-like protein with peptidoglycan-binding domain